MCMEVFVLSSLLFSLLLSAHALVDTGDTVFIGIEPHRQTQTYRAQEQLALSKQVHWQDFLRDNLSWNARFDEQNFTIDRAWGKGIYVGDTPSVSTQSVFHVLHKYNLLSIDPNHLQLRDAGVDSRKNRQYLFWQQRVHLPTPVFNANTQQYEQDIPVWRSGVHARIQDGLLTMFSVQTVPSVDTQQFIVNIGAIEAIQIAIQQGFAPQAFHFHQQAKLVVIPIQQDVEGKTLPDQFRLCWEVRSETFSNPSTHSTPRGKWVAFVDAQTGQLHTVYNEVRFIEGTMLAEHDTRTVDGNFSISPMPRLNLGSNSNRTEIDGTYSFEEDGSELLLELTGRRTIIENQAGAKANWVLLGGEQTWTTTDATQAELDQYIFQNRIYDWAEAWAPHVVTNWPRARVHVNLNEYCNAYFDGDLNFFESGGGCNNTGRIADVAYHEWGHGFHYYNMLSGEYDGTMGEGIGDVIAFLQTNDHIVAPNFQLDGSAIRNVERNLVYPEDIVDEVHHDGLIFAGSVWDWWTALKGEFGEDDAYSIIVPVVVDGLRAGPVLTTVFDEFVFADDDNADLSDGTPHQCSLIDAFALHGLGPNGGNGLLALEHADLGNQTQVAVQFDIEANFIQFAEDCVDAIPEQAIIHYSWDNGISWEEKALDIDITQDSIQGNFPAPVDNTIVQYYLSLEDSQGNVVRIPQDGDRSPFTFYVGPLETIFCSDFEQDDGGFTHSLLSGTQQEGADDWQWGTPNGLGGDPSVAASGVNIWGNDLGGLVNGQQYNGEYQNDKHTALQSPSFTVEGYAQVVLTYDRWLQVEDGFYDQAWITANGEVVWQNHASSQNAGDEHHRDNQWQNHAVLIDVQDQSSLDITWEINSDRGLTMGGWNIDNVCVYGVPVQVDTPVDTEEDSSKKRGCSSVGDVPHTLVYCVLPLYMLYRRRYATV